MKIFLTIALSLLAYTLVPSLLAEDIYLESQGVVVEHYRNQGADILLGPDLEMIYGEQNFIHSTQLPALTRITRQFDGTVLFEKNTLDFASFFVSPEGIVIAYNPHKNRSLPNLMVFENTGEVAFLGYADLYLKQFVQNSRIPIISSHLEVESARGKEQFVSVTFDQSDQDLSDTTTDNDDNQQRIIILSCGGVSMWLDQILSVTTTDDGRFEGFWFIENEITQYFDLEMHQFFIEEENRLLVELTQEINPLDCEDKKQIHFYDGANFSHWCENDNQIRVGKMQRWTREEPDQIAEMQENIGEYDEAFLFAGDFFLSMQGDYDEYGRTGVWIERYIGEEYRCEFVNDRLNGECINYYEGIVGWSAQFSDGLANGLEEEFDSDGSLDLSQTRLNGMIEGGMTEYHNNGQVSYQANYSDGLVMGRAYIYNSEGQLTMCEDYDNGELISSSKSCAH